MKPMDFKKEYKDLYQPKTTPEIIDVPAIPFLTVQGKGNPNTSEEYKEAVEVLYGLSYTIKMSKLSENTPIGYFDYVVPPLEGLWWGEGEYFDGVRILDKDKLCWISLIRQPEFVTIEVLEQAKMTLRKKKPKLDLSKVKLDIIQEGRCVQMMHIGSFDEEPKSIQMMNEFLEHSDYITDITKTRQHHEIYLGDPRKTELKNMKTIIRHPIKKR